MRFQVGLLDKSEIIKKMISHCLHYFVVDMHYFTTLDECLIHAGNHTLNIIFVDWEMAQNGTPLIYLIRSQLSSIPVVLMYRSNWEAVVSQIDKNTVPHRLTKPINPKTVRDIFSSLVPEVKKSSIHSFLIFPQHKEGGSPAAGTRPLPQKNPPQSSLEDSNQKTGVMSYLEKADNSLGGRQNKEEGGGGLAGSSKGGGQSFLGVDEKALTQTGLTQVQTSINGSPLKLNKIDKNKIVLDEDTQNDLAPMAIKSAASKRGSAQNGAHPLSEKQVLDVLMKYKDSLEFTNLMEKVLSDYAKQAVVSLLQPDQVKNLVKKPMRDFKESESFKKLVEREISHHLSGYLKKELPLAVKSVIEAEIKKIIGD